MADASVTSPVLGETVAADVRPATDIGRSSREAALSERVHVISGPHVLGSSHRVTIRGRLRSTE
jgi:hypothetical protein